VTRYPHRGVPARLPEMNGFLLLLLEAGVALALLVFIVWWTMPRRKRPGDGGDRDDGARR